MNTRTRTLLALIVLAAVTAGAWFATGGLGEGGATDAPEALTASGPAPLAPASPARQESLVGLAMPEDVGSGSARIDVTPDEPGEVIEGVSGGFWRAPKGSVWVEGRVELPPGTPLDESIIIVARGAAFENRPNSEREMRVRADEQGRFSVAFAKKTRTGRLYLEGRFLYLSSPKKVKLRELEDEIVLEPKLGGRIAATLLAPATHAMDEGVFDGTEVVATAQRGFGSNEHEGIRIEESVFAIGGLDASRDYIVIGRSPHFADGELEKVEIEPGQTTSVDLELSIGVTITGEVLDDDGAPVVGAEVLVMTRPEAERRNPIFNEKQQGAPTDRQGRFELPGAEPGDLALVVDTDGFLELRHELGELKGGQRALGVRLQLDRGKRVSGIVKWPDGEPADGAQIRVAQKWGRGGFRIERVKADFAVGSDGRFEVAALTEDECNVTASSLPRGLSASEIEDQEKLLGEKVVLWSATRADVEPGTQNIVLTLRPGDAIEGLVVDDQGEPVERFKVVATPAGTNMISSTSLRPLRARVRDEGGKFELKGLQPAEWKVRVTAVGYGTPEDQSVTVPYGGGKLRFVLPRSGSISGLVVDPDGEPIAEARVLVDHGPRSAASTTDADGKFAVTKIMPGWVDIRASVDGFGRSEPVRVQMAASGDIKNVRLALTPGAIITGELHPAVGALEDRRVTLTGEARKQATTDASGHFEFEGLSEGTYKVRLEEGIPRGRGRGNRENWVMRMANRIEADVEVDVGGRAHVLLGAPSETSVRITGEVTRAGEPVATAMVTYFSRDDGSDPLGAVYTDASGNYEIDVDGPGEYRFMVGEVGSQATYYETVGPEEEQRIDFAIPTGSIVGKVSGPDGDAIEGVLVTLDDSANSSAAQSSWLGRRSKMTDESGEFEFEGISPGVPYVLRAGGPMVFNPSLNATEGLSRFIKSGVEIEDGQELRLDIELSRAGWLEGTVVDSDGMPIQGAEVVVLGDGDVPLSLGSERSRANGAFHFEGVAPGDVVVYARRGGVDGERVSARVFEGAGAELRLVVQEE